MCLLRLVLWWPPKSQYYTKHVTLLSQSDSPSVAVDTFSSKWWKKISSSNVIFYREYYVYIALFIHHWYMYIYIYIYMHQAFCLDTGSNSPSICCFTSFICVSMVFFNSVMKEEKKIILWTQLNHYDSFTNTKAQLTVKTYIQKWNKIVLMIM